MLLLQWLVLNGIYWNYYKSVNTTKIIGIIQFSDYFIYLSSLLRLAQQTIPYTQIGRPHKHFTKQISIKKAIKAFLC